jgi:glycosyltransferase involved in cell wall biosynthesis
VTARIAVVIPCADDVLVEEAAGSIHEHEPVEVIIVDDASTDPRTGEAYARLEARGVRVIRHDRNLGVSAARNTGWRASGAPFVFNLDSDDMAIPGVLAAMADRLERRPDAGVCYGDYREFGDNDSVRGVPSWVDPYRLAFISEYPPCAMWARWALEQTGGWPVPDRTTLSYEDWRLWATVAEQGIPWVYMGRGNVTYLRRLHGPRRLALLRDQHRTVFRDVREHHPWIFENVRAHRRLSDLSLRRKLLYPLLYGGRPRLPFEPQLRYWLDRVGIRTST